MHLILFCQALLRGSTYVFQYRNLRFGIVVNNYAVGLIIMYHFGRSGCSGPKDTAFGKSRA